MIRGMTLGAALCLIFFAALTAQESAEIGNRIGNTAIDFALNDLDGNEVILSDHFGKVIVLTFWDWGCIECREKSMPELQKLVLDVYGADLVSIFAINVEPNPDVERMKQYVEEKGITYKLLLQGMQLAFDYRVYAIPILFVADKDGVIQYREQKSLENRSLETIAELVEEVVVAEQFGSAAIDFALPDLEGHEIALSDSFGKAIVLSFWDSRQPECWAELSSFQQMIYEVFDPDQVTVVTVDTNEFPDIALITARRAENNLTMPMLIKGMEIASIYKVFAAPASFLLDQEGVIQYRVKKLVDEEMLRVLNELVS